MKAGQAFAATFFFGRDNIGITLLAHFFALRSALTRTRRFLAAFVRGLASMCGSLQLILARMIILKKTGFKGQGGWDGAIPVSEISGEARAAGRH